MAVNKANIDYSLYLVTDRDILRGQDFLTCIEASLAGGVTLLQLREKALGSRDFYDIAVQVKQLCTRYKVPLIINDRLDIMLAIDADGLHIGQDDIPLETARGLIGPHKILGYSVSNADQALYGQQFADYLGAGVVFPTGSKSDAGEPIGVDGLGAITSASTIPAVAIGGISLQNLAEVKSAGVDGISVISAVLGQADITKAAQALLQAWREL
ncbi:MAG: thiamine phosphate synthase [Candidatus Saccharibacteria bacterium]